MRAFVPDLRIYQNLDRIIMHGDVYFLGGKNISFEISRLLAKRFLRLNKGTLTITDDGEIERDIWLEESQKQMRKEMTAKALASYAGDETASPPKERQRRGK